MALDGEDDGVAVGESKGSVGTKSTLIIIF